MFNYQQPFGYNPSTPYLPNFQTPQPNSQPTSNINWVYVSGVEGARNQIVQPGQTSWMMDNSDPVIYVKAVDSIGTSTFKMFRLTEVSTATETAETPHMDESMYVSKDDFKGISERLKALEDAIGGINV